jgi:glycosyltransferase involved in cell wall biosynthesis
MLLPMSDWLASSLRRGGVAPQRLAVVNPGVNVRLDSGRAIPERRRGPVRRLLLIGRDFDTKGGTQVVAAFRTLRAELGPSISLTIAGPATWPLRGDVPDGVTFLGPVTSPRVVELLDTHDLFVMPSLFEGFGIAFVEALVRGLPCIGRDDCAMPEIIDPQSGGRLVSSESSDELAALVVEALNDDDLYTACADAAPARREHYAWPRAAAEIRAAAQAVVS